MIAAGAHPKSRGVLHPQPWQVAALLTALVMLTLLAVTHPVPTHAESKQFQRACVERVCTQPKRNLP